MLCRCCRIGLAIAERLGRDGAHVVVSSRRQKNVDRAVERLRAKDISVTGVACHVGDSDARRNLVEHVSECRRLYGSSWAVILLIFKEVACVLPV